MTLCVAAISRKENKIVTVSDFLLSTDWDSSESPAMKIAKTGFKNRWRVMFAGDPSTFIKVNTKATSLLAGTKESTKDIMAAFQDAFQDTLKSEIEGAKLSRYGMTRKQFLEKGRQNFGKEEFLRILREVQSIGLETEFLVAGFDDNEEPSLVSIDDDSGTPYIRDLSSYHAIGSGAPLAEASLMGTFNTHASVSDIVYRLSEAKFLSERSPFVGESTFVTVFGLKNYWNAILPPEMEKIKKLWKEKGIPPIPVGASKLITENLKPLS